MTGGFGSVDDETANPDLKQHRCVGFGGRMRRVRRGLLRRRWKLLGWFLILKFLRFMKF